MKLFAYNKQTRSNGLTLINKCRTNEKERKHAEWNIRKCNIREKRVSIINSSLIILHFFHV